MSRFDDCFKVEPDFREKPHDYSEFWKAQLSQLKKIPIQESFTKTAKSTFLSSSKLYELTFSGSGKHRITADVYFPDEGKKKLPVVIIFDDYMEDGDFNLVTSQKKFIVIRMRLRGSDQPLANEEGKTRTSYGYFTENLTDAANYYMKHLYLDAYRTIEVARLHAKIDTSKIFIWGIGIGGALAVFTQAFMGRGVAIALENPSFINMPHTQNIATAHYAEEINSFIKKNKTLKKSVKRNLAYLDAMFTLDKLNVPFRFFIDINQNTNPPHGGFTLFHGINTEKEMHIDNELFQKDTEQFFAARKKRVEAVFKYFVQYL